MDKIESRRAAVAVVGLGYVGLPLAVAFAEAGLRVVGIDIDGDRVDAINRGESYVSDVPAERLAALVTAAGPSIPRQAREGSHEGPRVGESSVRRQRLPTADTDGLRRRREVSPDHVEGPVERSTVFGRLFATTDYDVLHDVDAVIICVPTPLGKTKDPDMSHIIAATDEIARRLHPDMLIVLESTSYPGTTEELILPRLEGAEVQRSGGAGEQGSRGAGEQGSQGAGEQGSGGQRATVDGRSPLAAGRDFFLAFSPERLDPGRRDYTIHNTPKVIGGVTPRCTEVARVLYECAIEKVVAVTSPSVAEMVKLLENTFRAVNIALVNEVAIMCDRLGIDVWEVVEAAETKPFGFMTFHPGPGLGGHCIPIDPQYLAWKLKTVNYNARFIQLASEINFGMPQYVLGKIADALNEAGKPFNGSRVLILGVAYKADVGDLRESPALDLIHLLQEKGANVAYHDPYVPRLREDGIAMAGETLNRDTLQAADCVVITAAHSSYDWEWIVENSRLIVDTRNATRDVRAGHARVVKL